MGQRLENRVGQIRLYDRFFLPAPMINGDEEEIVNRLSVRISKIIAGATLASEFVLAENESMYESR